MIATNRRPAEAIASGSHDMVFAEVLPRTGIPGSGASKRGKRVGLRGDGITRARPVAGRPGIAIEPARTISIAGPETSCVKASVKVSKALALSR